MQKLKKRELRNEKLDSSFFQPFFTIFILECGETITQESINLYVCTVKFTIIQNVFLNIYCSLFKTLPSLLALSFSQKC